MRILSYIAVFLGGAIACLLLFSLGAVSKGDAISRIQQVPEIALPTYLSFLGVMLTAVTVVLTALAIGIGVIAAFTFRGIKDEVQLAVKMKVDSALSDNAIKRRIDQVALAQQQNPTVAEIEEGFDPTDDGDR